MRKVSAQLPINSDAWHITRCYEGQCAQSDETNEAAKDSCWRDDCVIGQAKLLTKKLEKKLALKTTAIAGKPFKP
jgi:hypothetical protein